MLQGLISALIIVIIIAISALIRKNAATLKARKLLNNCVAGPETINRFIYNGQPYDEVKFYANCLNATKGVTNIKNAEAAVALAASKERYSQIYAKAYLKNFFETEMNSEGMVCLEDHSLWISLNENNQIAPDIKAMISELPEIQKKMKAEAAAASADKNRQIYESLSDDELMKIIHKKGYREEAKNLAREILSSRGTENRR